MDVSQITLLVVFVLMLTLATGLPIAFSLFGLAMLFDLIFLGPKSLYLAFSALYGNMDQELFIAIPLFVLMASLLQISGIAKDLYDAMHKWMSGLSGGLAMGTVMICTLIDAMSGLGATATITMGVLALPEMLRRGYHKHIVLGCIPAGGALGPLIPPSIIMIMLGGLKGLSVGKLFMGGVIPGFSITFLWCLYIGVRCFLNPRLGPPLPIEERGSWREKLISLRGVILAILLVVLIMGGIYSGAFTPTEASGIGAAGTFLIVLGRRKLTWENLQISLYTTMRINAMVLWLLIGGTAFSAFLNSIGVTQYLTGFLAEVSGSKLVVVWIMIVITLIMGCFIDAASILMICTPVFFPVLDKLGLDPIWFSIIFTIAMVSGYITPPFGMNLFLLKGLVPKDITMNDIWRSILPFTLIMIIVLALCIHFPGIAIWLPSLMK
jgi:tripartite ATP-independent transporter DctM subunit